VKSNIQLKYSNYVAFSHIRGKVVNNSGIIYYFSKKRNKGHLPKRT